MRTNYTNYAHRHLSNLTRHEHIETFVVRSLRRIGEDIGEDKLDKLCALVTPQPAQAKDSRYILGEDTRTHW